MSGFVPGIGGGYVRAGLSSQDSKPSREEEREKIQGCVQGIWGRVPERAEWGASAARAHAVGGLPVTEAVARGFSSANDMPLFFDSVPPCYKKAMTSAERIQSPSYQSPFIVDRPDLITKGHAQTLALFADQEWLCSTPADHVIGIIHHLAQTEKNIFFAKVRKPQEAEGRSLLEMILLPEQIGYEKYSIFAEALSALVSACSDEEIQRVLTYQSSFGFEFNLLPLILQSTHAEELISLFDGRQYVDGKWSKGIERGYFDCCSATKELAIPWIRKGLERRCIQLNQPTSFSWMFPFGRPNPLMLNYTYSGNSHECKSLPCLRTVVEKINLRNREQLDGALETGKSAASRMLLTGCFDSSGRRLVTDDATLLSFFGNEKWLSNPTIVPSDYIIAAINHLAKNKQNFFVQIGVDKLSLLQRLALSNHDDKFRIFEAALFALITHCTDAEIEQAVSYVSQSAPDEKKDLLLCLLGSSHFDTGRLLALFHGRRLVKGRESLSLQRGYALCFGRSSQDTKRRCIEKALRDRFHVTRLPAVLRIWNPQTEREDLYVFDGQYMQLR